MSSYQHRKPEFSRGRRVNVTEGEIPPSSPNLRKTTTPHLEKKEEGVDEKNKHTAGPISDA